MMRVLVCIAAIAPLLCGQGSNKKMDVQALSQQAKVAAAAQNGFGLELVAQLAAEQPHKNIFISPTSVFLALMMAETGSEKKTLTALRHTMSVADATPEEALHQSASAMSKALRAHQDVELSIANALWSDVQVPLAPAFIARCRELYAAEAFSLEFKKPGAADQINAWVRKETRDKIKEIVTQRQVAAVKAILTNAVYFKARWLEVFSKDATQDAPFHLVSGGQKQVPMMHQDGLRGLYRSGPGYEAAMLPYGRSGMALYAILPAQGKKPEEVVSKMAVDKLMNDFTPYELEVRLPRFSMDFSASLRPELIKMGAGIAFQFPGAEFRPLGSPLFYLGDVLHKTRLEIDEEGTVAAAVTAIMAPVGAAMPQKREKRVLNFDRPFGLILADSHTGVVLFAGVVYEP
jgi:serpin B